MSLDYSYVSSLSSLHPAWRLLRMRHAPLIISFLHRTYLEPNRRLLAAAEFRALLEDELYMLRQSGDSDTPARDAAAYLADWLSDGILRRTWAGANSEEHIDITPQTEKAIHWVASLRERTFVGTESRLLTFVELVRQMAEESDSNVERRLAVLHRQREELDAKIDRVSRGEVEVLSEFELRDRFQQLEQLGRGLLSDFREVEENFRKLSRSARERIALWDGSKGQLLDELCRSDDEIKQSDQGRTFEAFCDFLLSVDSREELASHLATALQLPAVREQARDARLDRVHYDWISAGETIQETIASLSQQLRRFLDDQALLENRRIMEILRGIESHAIALRNNPPPGHIMWIDGMKCDIEIPMDRPLYRPIARPDIADIALEHGQAEEEATALYSQTVVDRGSLARHIATVLSEHGPVTLRELTQLQPIQRGLAEVVTYLDLGFSRYETELLDFMKDDLDWQVDEIDEEVERKATMQRILFREKTS